MPRGQKRAVEDGEPRATRSKVAKTAAKGGKRGPKTSLGAGAFKAKALPLHVNVTHTPPVLADGAVDAAQTDPGFVGSSTLVPTSFSMGSYGWKGQKRVTIELEGENGEKEKVQVMLNINATVLGSKSAPDDEHDAAEPQAETADADVEMKTEAEPQAKPEEEATAATEEETSAATEPAQAESAEEAKPAEPAPAAEEVEAQPETAA